MTIRHYADRVIQGMDINKAFDHYKRNFNIVISTNDMIISRIDFFGRILLYITSQLFNAMSEHEEMDVVSNIYAVYGNDIDNADEYLIFLINLTLNSNYDKIYFIEEVVKFSNKIMKFVPSVYNSFTATSNLPEKRLSSMILFIHPELLGEYNIFKMSQ